MKDFSTWRKITKNFQILLHCSSRRKRLGKERWLIVFWWFAPFFGAPSGFERRTMGGGG